MLVPILAISDVAQVPILLPMVMNMACSIVISPLPASAIKIPVIAAELCKSPVSTTPMRKSRNGLSMDKNSASSLGAMTSSAVSTFTASLMNCKPIKIKPIPIRILPICLERPLFPVILITSPAAATAEKTAAMLMFMLCNDMICAEMVVPMLAPMMMAPACVRLISPTFTNPTIMTVVAEELLMMAVTAAPIPTPAKRLLETLASMVRMLEPAARSRLEPIVFIPIMNTVMPPITSNNCVIIVSTIRLYPCRIKYVFNRPKKGGADAPAFPMP